MIIIEAKIKLYQGIGKRQIGFQSGYRPMFEFSDTSRVSGHIALPEGMKSLEPGDSANVQITFLNDEYLGDDFGVGKNFFFYESKEALGEGVINKILDSVTLGKK